MKPDTEILSEIIERASEANPDRSVEIHVHDGGGFGLEAMIATIVTGGLALLAFMIWMGNT